MKLRMILNIILGKPVMYKMDIGLSRVFDKKRRKYTNVMVVNNEHKPKSIFKTYIVDNKFTCK